MKVGDLIPVNIGQGVVAQAQIESINEKDSTVTMVIPASRVVMSFSRQLETHNAPETHEKPSVTHEVLGVEQTPQNNVSEPEAVLAEEKEQAQATPPADSVVPAEPAEPAEVVSVTNTDGVEATSDN